MHDWVLAAELHGEGAGRQGLPLSIRLPRNSKHVDRPTVAQTLPAALEWLWNWIASYKAIQLPRRGSFGDWLAHRNALGVARKQELNNLVALVGQQIFRSMKRSGARRPVVRTPSGIVGFG